MTSVSPLCIKLMFACYVTPEPAIYFGADWNSPAASECRRWLQENGLITDKYEATERGKAWVEFICATPLPQQSWILPERENGK